MGKKKINARRKQDIQYVTDNSEIKKIKIDLGGNVEHLKKYDESNALVIPSRKRHTKALVKEKKVTRILSKKQRKNLEKIVDKKLKKENRSTLLDNLLSVQLPADKVNQLVSITAVQTSGIRKFSSAGDKVYSENGQTTSKKPNSIAGSRKRKVLERSAAEESEDSSEEESEHPKMPCPHPDGFYSSSESEAETEETRKPAEIETLHVSKDLSFTVEDLKENGQIPANEIHSTENSFKVSDVEAPAKPRPPSKPAVYVHVERKPEIQAARLKLPILGEEQIVMEAINENDVVIIAGETGSGKTTQVPQFLYEAGYAVDKLIGITEPRRVAAISMSKRVAEEMNLSQDVVSYLIRFEGNTTTQTKVKFMTDGVLLKEMEMDFELSKYSVIILDEAHERSVYTDILLGLLSRVVPLRKKKGNPLKLVIMSATLRVSDFTENERLFKTPPPVIKVEARQFPVTVHFNKVTDSDYVKEAFRKAVKIHSKLPDGGILIFLTGQQEVNYLVKKLRMKFPKGDKKTEPEKDDSLADKEETEEAGKADSDEEFDMERAIRRMKKARKKFAKELSLPKINLDTYKLPGDDTEADLIDTETVDENLSEDEEDPYDEEALGMATSQPLWTLPLYSLLSSAAQERVFQPPPEGTRLCVVATNVAETSLTIPNIKYVIDCGRQKVRLYDPVTGVEAYVVKFTSKASANQRSGRAGRTGPGHCYRIYSSAVYNNEFPDFSVPDILKRPVDDIVLQMKCMGITKVVNFPFPTSPESEQLQMAETRLKILGALEESSKGLKVTELGNTISLFSIAPRFGKMLALSNQHNLMSYTICIVSALSVQQVLLENTPATRDANNAEDAGKWAKRRKAWAGSGHFLSLGDPMVLLRAVGGAEYAGSENKLPDFCRKNGLRLKAVTEIRKLRVQLTNQLNLNIPNVDVCVDPKLGPPTDDQAKLLRQILLAGMGDRVARRVPMEDISNPRERIRLKRAYNTPEMIDPVFLNSSSVLASELPEWVIYQEVYEVLQPEPKMFIRGITEIEPQWLPIYVPTMCNFQEIADEKPKYNRKTGTVRRKMRVTFGRAAWPLPDADVDMPFGVEACKHFGMILLSGEVFPTLAKYTPQLLSTPASMIRSYSNIIPRVTAFIKALVNRQITSKPKLMEIWQKDPKYLLSEYQQWLPSKASMEVSSKWPPTDE
ncbi:probable ATP-dependent RNA helicase kurz [Phlebotomus argentipes]|uniref:probable ATP-dependent RNA helicase kurz n=1 Tax=Phlebotomus argentipes TaxID=94469 RepID=UPI0028937C27|nr:probable ATP-dependent RNA helicase kurz [Phlebotomus argentipes]